MYTNPPLRTPPHDDDSIFFGGKKQVLSQRDREALMEKWGDKVQKVEEEAFHLFSSLDWYARVSCLHVFIRFGGVLLTETTDTD